MQEYQDAQEWASLMGAPPRPLTLSSSHSTIYVQVARLVRQQQPGVAQGWQDNKRELHAQLRTTLHWWSVHPTILRALYWIIAELDPAVRGGLL